MTTKFFAMNLAHEYDILEKKHGHIITRQDNANKNKQIQKIELIEKRMLIFLKRKYEKNSYSISKT